MEREGELSRPRTTQPLERQRNPGKTKPQETSKCPATNRERTDWGGGEGTKTHPPPEQPGGKGPTAEMAQCGRTAAPDEAMETVAGDGGTGHPPKHFDGADGAMIK